MTKGTSIIRGIRPSPSANKEEGERDQMLKVSGRLIPPSLLVLSVGRSSTLPLGPVRSSFEPVTFFHLRRRVMVPTVIYLIIKALKKIVPRS